MPASRYRRSEDAGSSDPGAAAWSLLVAAGIGAVEALGFLVLAVADLGVAVSEGAAGAVAGGLFFAACGFGLAWAAGGLVRRESWSRGPLLAAQLLLLALAWSYHRPYPLAAALVATATVVALVLLVLPATTRALPSR